MVVTVKSYRFSLTDFKITVEGTSQDDTLTIEGSYIVTDSNTTDVMKFGGTATMFLVADDATGIGVGDDLLIPFVMGGTLLVAAGVGVYETYFTDADEKEIPYAMELDIAERQENYTPIYRLGSGTATNLTPRTKDSLTGLSYTLIEPVGVKYTVTYLEVVNSTGMLKAVPDGGFHVSVSPVLFPAETDTMNDWVASRPNAETNPHYLTAILQEISTKVKP